MNALTQKLYANISHKKMILFAAVAILIFPAGYLSYRIYAFLPLLLTLLIGFVWFFKREKWPLALHRQALLLVLGVLTVSAVSLLWAEFYQVSEKRVFKIVPICLGAILPLCYVQKCHLKSRFLYPVMLVSWALTLVFMLIDIFFTTPIYGLLHEHNYLLPQLNRYAIVLLIGYVFVCALAPYRLSILLALPMAVFLWKTESQSVQLSALALVFFAVMWMVFRHHLIYLFGVSVTVITLCFPWLSKWMFLNRPDEISGILAKGAPYSRLEIWDAISTKILQSPWLGYGIENIRETPLLMEHLYWRHEGVLHPHNYALQLWVEFGLVGVILFLVWMWWALLKLRHFDKVDLKLALALMVCIFSVNLTAYGLWQGWWIGVCFLTWIGFYIVQPSRMRGADD